MISGENTQVKSEMIGEDDNHSDVDDIVLFLQYIDEQPVEEQHAEEQSDQERYVRIVGGVLANCTTPGGQPKFFFFFYFHFILICRAYSRYCSY